MNANETKIAELKISAMEAFKAGNTNEALNILNEVKSLEEAEANRKNWIEANKDQLKAFADLLKKAEGVEDVRKVVTDIQNAFKLQGTSKPEKAAKTGSGTVTPEQVLNFLKKAGEAVGVSAIAKALAVESEDAKPAIKALVDAGKVTKDGQGRGVVYTVA